MKKILCLFVSVFMILPVYAASVNIDEPKTIIAPKIEYNVKSETLTTTGKTEIVNASGQRLTLTDSYLSKSGDKLVGDDMKLWLGNHVYVESDSISRNTDETIARHAMFTACDGCDKFANAWEITARKIIHDMEKRMLYFHSSTLWAYGAPIFWLPYYAMPDPGVKHKTGFLMPDFESTNNMGTQINVPFYVSLSDTHDLTLKLSYLTQENPLFQVEHRLNADHSEYRTKASFTRNKDGENRWHINNNDVIELGEYARATVYLERASDKTYLQKYGFYGDQPYLDSGAKLELFGQSGYVVADAHIFQELRTTSYLSGDILPNIRGVYQTEPLFGETYMTFGTDILGISGSKSSSQRMIGNARITTPWTLWGGNRITASLATRYDIYNFDNTLMINGDVYSGIKNRFLPSGYLEWGLPLMRVGKKWMQTIEPRARLTVMRHIDQAEFAKNNDSAGAFLSDTTLFSSNRFAGLDLWENGTFADYGVRWTAFNNVGRNVEVFLGQSYDITDRPATDPNSGFHNGASDYVGRVEYNNSKWLNLRSRFRVAENDFSLLHMETSALLGSSANNINIGHIWSQRFIDERTMDDDINEVVLGASVKLSPRWAVRWNGVYNITYDHFQRHTGGLFYNHPCYYMSLEYRRDNAKKQDYVGTTTFQFRIGMSIEGQHY